MHHSSFAVSLGLPVSRSCVGADEADFGSATLTGIPSLQLNCLQAVMNAAARLVFQSSQHDHITLLLYRLHWLRSLERIAYKHAVLVYQCLHVLTPVNLIFQVENVFVHHQPRHWLHH